MEHVPPPAEELARLDRELAELDARRAQLLTRRAWLLAALRPPAPTAAPGWNPSGWGAPHGAPSQPWGYVPKQPSAPRSAQNVLLTLGGLLLTIAAVAFTLVSWGSMGIGGRSAVLAAMTLGALIAPAVLLRRKLAATAEALAALALVLTLLDVYAVHAVAAPGTDGLGFTAVASVVLAALWTAYGLTLGKLRLPLPAAVVLAQWPLLFWAWAAGAPALVVGWALLATAVLDGTIALRGKGTGVRVTACVGGSVMGFSALLVGLALSMTASGPLGAVAPGAVLLAAAAAALAGAWRAPKGFAQLGGVVVGLAAVAAVGGVPVAAVPDAWHMPAYLLCGLALMAVVRTRLPRNATRGVLAASGAVAAWALVWTLPPLATVLLGPVTLLSDVWAGAPEGFRSALGSTLPWPEQAGAPVVLALVAGLLGSAYRWWPSVVRITAPLAARVETPGPDTAAGTPGTAWTAPPGAGVPWYTAGGAGARRRPSGAAVRGAVGAGAVALGWGAFLLAGALLDVPYALAVAGETALVGGLLALAVRGTGSDRDATAAVPVTALVAAVSGAVSVGVLSLASEGASYAVFGTLAVLFAGAAVRAGGCLVDQGRIGRGVWCGASQGAGTSSSRSDSGVSATPRGAVPGVADPAMIDKTPPRAEVPRAVFAVAAVVWATVLTGFAGRSLGLAPHEAAPLLLVVPALTVLLGARLRRNPTALPVELTGATGALVAVGLAVSDEPFLALVLALCGVLAAGAAVRPERRPAAGYLAAALFVLATWVRLAASEVSFPEAYTLPVTVPALVVGVLRRRRDPEASSWTAYGPGLAATLLPSLAVAWTDTDWLRPLLLGVAALVVTLLGARYRLQALLLLGGAVLALDGLHELAPYVLQVAGALPRWLPPALAGLLLLMVGATYEQRLRDARRLKDALGRMR
ncbi:SCO7613 C-terminal domain-containing membrane protein [Streptomyces sp. SM11]|uniref:SCO7613 C-terminal domain-containing membrane protein n=1 Tax=Streptomyces sp. SM11 TaxID=565557 RepID=UPI0015E16460|nr:hypothetical protein [Streptomyces sp. SM11]